MTSGFMFAGDGLRRVQSHEDTEEMDKGGQRCVAVTPEALPA
jgi:hypothetical protein